MVGKSTFTNTVLSTIVLSIGLNVMTVDTSVAFTAPESTTILRVDKPPKKEERIAFARALRKEIDQIHNLIPNLSPSQEKWLHAQLSSNNTNRKTKAYESDEFVLQTTKSKTGEIKTILEEIIEGNVSGQLMNQRDEVFNWLYVSTGLIDFYIPLGIAKLINKKLIIIPEDGSLGEIGALGLRFNGIGSSILTAIVGSYIVGKLPE